MAFEIVIFLNLYRYANSSIFCFYCHMSRETSSANKCTKHEIISQKEGMQLVAPSNSTYSWVFMGNLRIIPHEISQRYHFHLFTRREKCSLKAQYANHSGECLIAAGSCLLLKHNTLNPRNCVQDWLPFNRKSNES